LLGVGNGAVNWAEQRVSSGLTALIIAATPLWFALFDWLRPGGIRPALQTTLGIAVGFFGVLMLIGSRSSLIGGAADFRGVVALLCASAAWAVGSLYTKYSPEAGSPLIVAAQQMIAGGIILALIGVAMGEAATFHAVAVSPRSLAAFMYLTLIGSLVGFSTYAWLLNATTPARLSTYAYVNPVIAVFLGWAFGGEKLTVQTLVAACIILGGVVIITARRRAPMSSAAVQVAPAATSLPR
jgi:drug/metabolite transporter (DMT)-like permease